MKRESLIDFHKITEGGNEDHLYVGISDQRSTTKKKKKNREVKLS